MGIKFLQVNPEQAFEALQECARKGYALRHAMQTEHDTVGGPSGVTDEIVSDWIRRINEWSEETRQILLRIYSSPNYMYHFLETKPDAVHNTSEERRFGGLKKALLQRIEKLNSYVDFIIQNSNTKFSTENNFTYLNLNPERDLNIAGKDINTDNT